MIVTISGVSGTGKTTIAKTILEVFLNSRMLESYTVRLARGSDAPGEYIHVSKFKFFILRFFGFFLWTVNIHGINYGTAKISILATVKEKNAIFLMILTPAVLSKLRKFTVKYGVDVLCFYILSPDPESLRKRLLKRGDKPEDVERRIHDCLNWDEKIRTRADIPFIFIKNEGDITEAANRVFGHLIERIKSRQ